MKILRYIFIFFIFWFFLPANAQFSPHKLIEIPDTIYKKSHLKSASRIIAVNSGIWAIEKYIRKDFFVDISWHSVKDNFRSGFMWDNDQFLTNMFDHPAHGSFCYNSARYNGMSYWETLPYDFAGSLIWEMFLEIEPPSINDLISSTIGGLAIGEATHRIAKTLKVSHSGGFTRVSKEIGSFLITPTETIHRLIHGDLWRIRRKSDKYSIIPVKFQAGAGLGYFHINSGSLKERSRVTLGFNVFYNDPFNLTHSKPFDYFNLKTTINFLSDQPFLNKLSIEALVWGKKLELKNNNQIFLGIFQHYNYFDSDTISLTTQIVPYKISSPASYGLGILYKTKNKDILFNSELHLNALLIGAGLTDHYHIRKRNYNFGVGFSGKFNSSLLIKETAKLNLDIQYYHLYTWDGIPPGTEIEEEDIFSIQGDKGNAGYCVINPSLEVNIFKPISVYFDILYHLRTNNYSYYDQIKESSIEFTGGILYNF